MAATRGRPRLPLPTAELVRLYEDEDWTYQMIANHFSCSVATARNHYRRARPDVPSRPRGRRSSTSIASVA